MLDNGWEISEPSDKKLKSKIKIIDDEVYGKILSIKTFSRETCFDYDFQSSNFLYKKIKFITRPTDYSVLYINVKIRSKFNLSKDNIDNIWLKIFSGQRPPQKVADDEWIVFIEPEEKENNWKIYTVQIPKQIQNTLSTFGWVIVGVKGVRLRGDMEIAKIIASTEI
jgi:hypothetical protein